MQVTRDPLDTYTTSDLSQTHRDSLLANNLHIDGVVEDMLGLRKTVRSWIDATHIRHGKRLDIVPR